MSVAVPVIDYIDPTVSPRLIYLLPGVTEYHPIDDIYAEVRTLRRLDEALRRHDMYVRAEGNIKKVADGSKRTPRFAVFVNTKVVPDITQDHDLLVTGEQLFTPSPEAEPTGSGPAVMDKGPVRTAGFDVNVDYTPAEAEILAPDLTLILDHARAANVQTKQEV